MLPPLTFLFQGLEKKVLYKSCIMYRVLLKQYIVKYTGHVKKAWQTEVL